MIFHKFGDFGWVGSWRLQSLQRVFVLVGRWVSRFERPRDAHVLLGGFSDDAKIVKAFGLAGAGVEEAQRGGENCFGGLLFGIG